MSAFQFCTSENSGTVQSPLLPDSPDKSLCHVYIKDEPSIEGFPPSYSPSPACQPLNTSRCTAPGPLPYLVLKLAGCGCPSYKDKKSYSSSTAKDWKTIWILLPSSATITQVQFAPFGYPYGKPGLSIVPFLPFKVPPQVWIKPGRERRTQSLSNSQWVCVTQLKR